MYIYQHISLTSPHLVSLFHILIELFLSVSVSLFHYISLLTSGYSIPEIRGKIVPSRNFLLSAVKDFRPVKLLSRETFGEPRGGGGRGMSVTLTYLSPPSICIVSFLKYRRVHQLIQDEKQGSSRGEKRKANEKKPDPRAVKRRKFYEDFEFPTATLDKSLPSSVDPFPPFILTDSWLYNLGSTQMPTILRDQILGQLVNASQEYRQTRKRDAQPRREAQAAREAAGVAEPTKLPRRGGKSRARARYDTQQICIESWTGRL